MAVLLVVDRSRSRGKCRLISGFMTGKDPPMMLTWSSTKHHISGDNVLSKEIVSLMDVFWRLFRKGKVFCTCYIITSQRPRNSGDSNDAHDTDSGWRQQIDKCGRCLLITYRVPAVKTAATPIFCFQGSWSLNNCGL